MGLTNPSVAWRGTRGTVVDRGVRSTGAARISLIFKDASGVSEVYLRFARTRSTTRGNGCHTELAESRIQLTGLGRELSIAAPLERILPYSTSVIPPAVRG
jgi:hypothetical protein